MDQTEMRVYRDSLVLQCRTLAGALESATGKKFDEPQEKDHDMVAHTGALEKHFDLLKAEIASGLRAKGISVPPTVGAPPPVRADTTPEMSEAATDSRRVLASQILAIVKPLAEQKPTLDEEVAIAMAASGCRTVEALNLRIRRDELAVEMAALPEKHRSIHLQTIANLDARITELNKGPVS